MSLETSLVILAAILPLLMAALGGHLASEKFWYRVTFWSLGFITAVIIIVTGVMNQRDQAKLQNQLNEIQKNTERNPNISVQPTPVTVVPPAEKSVPT
jgi:Na+/melibiose symporter-like transporter